VHWTTTGGTGHPDTGGFPHDAMLYDSTEELLATAVPFLRAGLESGEAAVVAVAPDRAPALRDALGGDPRVQVVDREQIYDLRAPAAIAAFRRMAEEHTASGAPRVRVLGQVDCGPTPRDWLEWERYESVINRALVGWDIWGVCAFDTRELPESVLHSAVRTHPFLVTSTSRVPSPAFTEPAPYLRSLPVPDEPLERTPPRLTATDVSDFIGLRHAVAAELTEVPARPEVIEDFLLAVDEMTSNALRHGRPPVSLRLWTAEDRLVCTIADGGPGWDDPFAGYGPAHGADLSRGGMGLWLARQLCDHVDLAGGAHHPGTGPVNVRLTTFLR
jgi:anti-sigma regulatory factor (Ser/Thr protein kinase)